MHRVRHERARRVRAAPGGWLELHCGTSGDVLAMTVHAQCAQRAAASACAPVLGGAASSCSGLIAEALEELGQLSIHALFRETELLEAVVVFALVVALPLAHLLQAPLEAG